MIFRLKNIYHLFLSILFMGLSFGISLAQPEGGEEDKDPSTSFKLTLNGKTKEQAKDVKEVLVVLYEDPTNTGQWVEVEKRVTDRKGEFKFELDLYSRYMVEVAKGGFSTKQVTFDTDVYEEGNKKHEFAFIVDLVPDDGFGYLGPVANVFYQIRAHEFDYELDYSKEEQDEWEREQRELEEQKELQRIAAEKKAELELLAKTLREDEAASMAEKIEAAVKLGEGDKAKTVNNLQMVFNERDTLKEEKANAMWDQLLVEKQSTGQTDSNIDFGALFKVAQIVEKEEKKKYEAEVQAEKEVIRAKVKEEQRLQQEALEKQKEIAKVEVQQKLAVAAKQEEERKKKEFEQKKAVTQTAIAASNGNAEVMKQEFRKVFAKNDPYKDEKAVAMVEEYEKLQQAGYTKSTMDFKLLFKAAENAELEAQKKEKEDFSKSQGDKYEELIRKMKERKQKDQQKMYVKFEEAIKAGAGDKEKLIQEFEKSFDSNDRFKRQKAEAMYAQYERDRKLPKKNVLPKYKIVDDFKNALPISDPNRQENAEKLFETYLAQKETIRKYEGDKEKALKELSKSFSDSDPFREQKAEALFSMFQKEKREQEKRGSNYAAVDFSSLFAAAENAEKTALEEERIEKEKAENELQKRIHEKFERDRKELEKNTIEVEEAATMVHKERKQKVKDKKHKAVMDAFEIGGGNKEATIEALKKTLPADAEYKDQKARAMFERHEENLREQAKSGNQTAHFNFESLFAAADQAELDELQRRYEAKMADRNKEIKEREDKIREQQAEILAVNIEEKKKENLELEEQLAIAQGKEEELKRIQANKELAAQQEKQKEEAEKLAKLEKQKEFSGLIANGNKAFDDSNWDEATNYYTEASKLFPDEDFPKQKLKNIEQKKAKEDADRVAQLEKEKKEAEKLAEKQRQEEYESLIAKGNNAMSEKSWDIAKDHYSQASSLYPKEKLPRQKIEEVAQLEAQEKALLLADAEKRKIQEEYNALIAKANSAFDEQDYIDAKEYYAEASIVKPSETYPKNRIEEIGIVLADIAKKDRLDKEYAKIIANADGALEFKKYEDARSLYNQALDIKPSDEYAQLKVDEVDLLIAERDLALSQAEQKKKEEEAKQKEYDKLIAEADVALQNKYLEPAKELYAEASALMPEVQYPKVQLEEVEELIRAAEKKRLAEEKANAELAEKRKQYDIIIDGADDLFNKEDYIASKKEYQFAKTILPDETYPSKRISEIEDIITEQNRRQAEYDDLIQQADGAYSSKFYEKAVGLYQKALIVKVNEEYPKERIDAIEQELADARERERLAKEAAQKKFEQEQEAKFNGFIESGDVKYNSGEYDLAIQEYANALEIKPNNVTAKSKKQDAESKWEIELERLEAEAKARSEAERKAAYEKLQAEMDAKEMDEEERRKAFLSQLARIYPQGVTEENIEGADYTLQRFVHNQKGVVTIYEKKKWNWGGEFHFKNNDIPITESLYDLEVKKLLE